MDRVTRHALAQKRVAEAGRVKVAIITQGFPPYQKAGTEIYTYHLAGGLRDAGHIVAVLAPRAWDQGQRDGRYAISSKDEVLEGILVRRISFNWRDAPNRHGYLFHENPLMEQVVRQFLQDQAPDVVHITSSTNLSASVITAVLNLRLPVVFTMTSYWFICPRTTLQRSDGTLCPGRQDGLTCLRCLYGNTRTWRFIQRFPHSIRQALLKRIRLLEPVTRWNGSLNLVMAVERRNADIPALLQRVDRLISPSRFLADTVAATGVIPRERIYVLPHGHDVNRAAAGREKRPSPYLRFGYTGHLLPHKGVHLLISAFNQLGENHRARLLIYGDLKAYPEYTAQLKQLAGANSSIQFCGKFNNKQIGHILRGIDVLVVPSTVYENAPVVIAEAFAAKTPVIASDLGGMAEAVQHEVSGLLFHPGDIADLSRQMRRFLDEPALVDRLRRQIPRVPSTKDEVRELECIYEEIVTKRKY